MHWVSPAGHAMSDISDEHDDDGFEYTADAMAEFLDDVVSSSDDELRLPPARDGEEKPPVTLAGQPPGCSPAPAPRPLEVPAPAPVRGHCQPKSVFVNGREMFIEVDEPEGEQEEVPPLRHTTVAMTTAVETDPTEVSALLYSSWLGHQRYHDDYKFANERFILYEYPADNQAAAGAPRVLLEQNSRIGKGGLTWDAAFMLSEHLLQHPPVACGGSGGGWTAESRAAAAAGPDRPWVVELGCGPGLAGLALAAVFPVDMTLTDVGPVVPLAAANASRNATGCAGAVAADELWWGRQNAIDWLAAHGGAP